MNAAAEELRRIHDETLTIDWQQKVEELNRQLGLSGDDVLSLSIPGLPPFWFNGDVEAIVPGRWVLVISLNHQLGGYGADEPQAEGLWDFLRGHNRNFWYPRFFRPLVQVASLALSDEVAEDDEREYATTSMVFVEFCPYASRKFAFRDQLAELTKSAPGFQTAARVFDVLVGGAQPALILINGVQTLASFENIYGNRMEYWDEVSYTSPSRPECTLWHKQGLLSQTPGKTPVVGFPFLRTPRSHNSNREIRELGLRAKRFVEGHFIADETYPLS